MISCVDQLSVEFGMWRWRQCFAYSMVRPNAVEFAQMRNTGRGKDFDI